MATSNYNFAINLLKENGLTITSSPQQIKNQTIQVMDPITKRVFAITKFGYIRSYGQSLGLHTTYQLNPKTPKSLYLTGKYPISRLLFPLQFFYMATLLLKSINRIHKSL